MPARDRLRSLRNFADLIRYLEKELAWPLQQYGFEELTFTYESEELGLREEDAAKVKAIHQLRPLASGQSWGIFFIEFEKKRLPVVVLRRILSLLVIKKRASAYQSERAAWQPEDLLFVSAFGDEATDQREIAFAHFLSAYNKQLKVQRGVFYTPPPLVSYIVRSVHELLQSEFGLADGLASTVTWGEMIQRLGGTSSTSPHPNAKDTPAASPSPPAAGGEGQGEVGQPAIHNPPPAIKKGHAEARRNPKSEV